ncbi:hypothetical protein ACFX15_031356 [Malus domestica]
MLDTEPAHCTLRARDSLTANSSDRLESSLLSLGVTRFRATHRSGHIILHHRIPNSKRTSRGYEGWAPYVIWRRRDYLFTKVQIKTTVGGSRHFQSVEGRRGRTNQDLRSARREFSQVKFKCALKRTACLYKKSTLDGISEIEEASSEFEEAIQKSKRQAQKSEKHLAFPDASAPVTRKLNFAKITGNLSKCRSQISKRRQSFPDTSAPITRKLSFAEITGNLSKRRSQLSNKR